MTFPLPLCHNWKAAILLMIRLSYPTHTAAADTTKDKYYGGTLSASGLNIHGGKSKILKVNSTSTVSVTLGVEAIEEVDNVVRLWQRTGQMMVEQEI